MVRLNNFDFSYSTTKRKVFNNLNLKILRGDKIQLKGESGSGKTTLFKILLSLYKKQLKLNKE